MGRKIALIIGNSRYDDPGLARLTTADVDVREVAGVLRTPEIGQFDEVVELPDAGLAVVRRSIARFFSQAKRDDLLVFYFSGHGVKDENGHLYLAVKDTEPQLLAGTSIEAAFITAQMDRSSSKRQVLILDCCHSGAFAYGAKAGAAQVVGTGPAFEGTGFGRVILTATDSTQYAWQGDQILGESDKSVFTHYLLEGLKTGDADCDGNGLITIDELYDYVYERVVSETPKQTPGKWSYKQQGDIIVARSPRPIARAAELPLELRALLESPLSRLRTEAIPELATLLQGRHRGLGLAARKALEDLCSDDSRKVSAASEAVLATLLQPEAAAAAAREADRIRTEAEQLAIEEVRRNEEIERQIHERRQKIAAHMTKASQAASHQEAIEALREALDLDPGHEAAGQLLEHHSAALEQMAAERVRLQKIDAVRGRIDELLHKEELNQAEQVLAQAEKDGEDPSAFQDVRQRLRDKQHDRLAFEVVEAARREFAAGDHESAVAALKRFDPGHPLVSRALEDLTGALERLRRQDEARRRSEAERVAREQEVGSLRQLNPEAAGLAELVESRDKQTRVSLRSVQSRLRLARPVELWFVLVSLVAGLLLLGLPGQEVPQPENTESRPARILPSQETLPPAPAASSLPPEPATVVKPSSAPPALSIDSSPTSRGSGQPPPAVVTASVEAQIARLLADGDRLLQARNHDGALSAYEEAGRLGSMAGRERAEKVRQEKVAQFRARLNRVERLLDTGEYDEALRVIEDASSLDPKNAEVERFRRRVSEAQSFASQHAAVNGPLTQQQIEAALKVLTPRRVAGLIREFGSTFILDAEGEGRFRAAASTEKFDPALVDEIVRVLAPPRNPSAGMAWIPSTDRRGMVWIPAGVFQMGSPDNESGREPDENRHAMTVANGFWMESTEVTYRAFQKFILANPEWQKSRIDSRLHDGNYLVDWKGTDFPSGKADAPVVNVSWYAARAYAAWAGKRLPTEAQWEYACRAKTQSAYWWGETVEAVPAGATSTGSTIRNPWGLTAMLGGVWEWTSSLYRPYPFSDDGRNDVAAQGDRVSRGASGNSGPGMFRSANRNRVAPATCSDLLGFRCIL